jgi:tetratricopeptide (TPR) repeat protein
VKIAADTKMAEIAGQLVEGEILLQQGKANEAATVFASCARIDSALRPKDGLARALFAASEQEQALNVFDRAAALDKFKLGPETVVPGEFTDLLFEKAECALAAHHRDDARALLSEYLKRRSASDPNVREVGKARESIKRVEPLQ